MVPLQRSGSGRPAGPAAGQAPAVLVVRPVPRGGRVRRIVGRLLGAAVPRSHQGSQARLAVLLLASAVGYAVLGYWPVAVVPAVMGVGEVFLVVRARRSSGGGASC